jgi:hypothetical protein
LPLPASWVQAALLVEELGLVYPDDFGVLVDEPQQFRRAAHIDALDAHFAVGHDVGP